MKPRRSLLWAAVGLSALAATLIGACPAAAKSYRIARVSIEAALHGDGSMVVSEARTFSFRGKFSYAYRDLPAGGPSTFSDFEVLENDHSYVRSGSHQPGTYDIASTDGRTRLTWYFESADESRTFVVRFRALSLVQRYQDAAVLYYKFVGDQWEVPQDNIEITIRPPSALPSDSVRVWLHGPLWAYSRIEQGGEITATCDHLPGHTYLEVRALYPAEAFPGAELRADLVRAATAAEERAWAEEADRAREAARQRIERSRRLEALGMWVIPPVALIALLAWWFIYRAYSNRPTVPSVPSVAPDVPDKTPPALVCYLLNGRQVSAGSLVATMLDLAERGFVTVRQDMGEVRGLFGRTRRGTIYGWQMNRRFLAEHGAELKDFERSLLDFIFSEIGKGSDSVSFTQIKKAYRPFAKFFRKWQKMVIAQGNASRWFDAGSIRGMYYSLGLGALLIVIAIPLAFLFRIWVIPLIVVGVGVLFLSLLIPSRTVEGETMARRWKAVARYLRRHEYESAHGRDMLGRISRYMVYGAVLGLPRRAFGELANMIPESERGTYLYWYVYAGGAGAPGGGFGEAFSAMMATATSSLSSASGAGGGASGGGGGGAGGGGGGAG